MLRTDRPFLSSITAGSLALIVVVGCKAPQAFGDRNSLIVYADSTIRAAIDSPFLALIERRAYTTRPERIFKVTFVHSTDTLWRDLRQWQQVVVIGTQQDDVVRRLGDPRQLEEPAPTLFQRSDVWARRQTVTVVVLPRDRPARAALTVLPDLYSMLEEQYAGWIRQRMYASGVNDSLASVLEAFGFSLRLPKIYDFGRQDSIFRFRSVYPDAGSLLRSLLVTWERGDALPAPTALQDWRARIDDSIYDPAQDILDEGIRYDTVTYDGRTAIELRGVWQDRSDFPAAGPFVVRAVPCPDQDRVYFLDAWVYAPGKDKYPYLVQLEVLLDSFRCADEEPVRISRSDLRRPNSTHSPHTR